MRAYICKLKEERNLVTIKTLSIMNTISTILISVGLCLISCTAYGFEIDSTEDSSIDFIAIEATLSSKIIHFQWDVNAEQSGDYFIIEKSTDQKEWRTVSQVESIANHKERHTYSVSEINLVEAKNEYFRISRIDLYGAKTVLDEINIHQPVLANFILIPIQGKIEEEIRLSYDSLISSHGELTVTNQAGTNTFKDNVYSEKGYNHYLLNIKDYEPGRYIIVIKDEFGNKITRALNIFDESKKRRKSKF